MIQRALLTLLALLIATSNASASTEINGLFDARSHAMGGTGAAFLDSAGAIPTNPSLLDQIGHLTLSVDAFFIASQPEAPYTISHLDASGHPYRNYESIRSSAVSAVLPFIGGAYRVADRVVLGAAIYPVIGQGTSAKYRPAPEQLPDLQIVNKASLGFIEAAVPVSVRLLDNLSVAAAWRITYMTQSVRTALPGGAPAGVVLDTMQRPVYADIHVTGVSFAGLQLGVLYRPLPYLRLGLTYRSKVTVNGSGTTDTRNPLDGAPLALDTQQSFSNPHGFRAGAALSALDERLLLALDFKYLMYAEAFKELDTTTWRDGKASTTRTPAHWKDAFNVHLGAEYQLSRMFAARAGYVLATSATRAAYAQQFMAPPGVAHCFTVGVGLKVLDTLNVDVAAGYVVLQSRVDVATHDNAGIGIYASHGIEASASLTYHR